MDYFTKSPSNVLDTQYRSSETNGEMVNVLNSGFRREEGYSIVLARSDIAFGVMGIGSRNVVGRLHFCLLWSRDLSNGSTTHLNVVRYSEVL